MHRRRFLHAAAGTVIGTSTAGCLGRLGIGGSGSSDGFEPVSRWVIGDADREQRYAFSLTQASPAEKAELWRSLDDRPFDAYYSESLDFPWGSVEPAAVDRVIQVNASIPSAPRYWLFERPFDRELVRRGLAEGSATEAETHHGFDCYTGFSARDPWPSIAYCVGQDAVLRVGSGGPKDEDGDLSAARRVLDVGAGDERSAAVRRDEIRAVTERLSPGMQAFLRVTYPDETGADASNGDEQAPTVYGGTASPAGEFVTQRTVRLLAPSESPSTEALRAGAQERHAANATEPVSVSVDDRIATVEYQQEATQFLVSSGLPFPSFL